MREKNEDHFSSAPLSRRSITVHHLAQLIALDPQTTFARVSNMYIRVNDNAQFVRLIKNYWEKVRGDFLIKLKCFS